MKTLARTKTALRRGLWSVAGVATWGAGASRLFAQEVGAAETPGRSAFNFDAAGADFAGLVSGRALGAELTPATLAVVLGPFALASLIALWFGVERLVVLRRRRVIPPGFTRKLIGGITSGSLNQQVALRLCEADGSVASAVFAEAVRRAGRPAMEIEKAISDAGERQVLRLRKNMRAIHGVATVTPLMGLLGTVLGMMISFVEVAGGQAGGGRTEELAVGIVTALSTTALGLAIAIPALVVYMILMSRIETLVAEVDEEARHLVDLVCAEGVFGGGLGDETVSDLPDDRPAPTTGAAAKLHVAEGSHGPLGPAQSDAAARRTSPLEISSGG